MTTHFTRLKNITFDLYTTKTTSVFFLPLQYPSKAVAKRDSFGSLTSRYTTTDIGAFKNNCVEDNHFYKKNIKTMI